MFDIKAILGIATTAAGLLALGLGQLGKQEAANAVKACVDHANSLGSDTLPLCKEAAKETARAGKELLGGVLVTIGNVFSLFGRVKR